MNAIIAYVKNKSASLLVLVGAIIAYGLSPQDMPFSELAYTCVTVLGVIVLAPIVRLLVFKEAANYAETGKLVEDLIAGKFTPSMIHYWFATAVSYLTPLACIMTIAK